ncbi:helix-turn-helix domain-containing protein [Kineosporia sp. NBRC 101731]|uniref:helix-turn-helix domain-containing protein n=1 Tax=Kineosporia sp. NBRC 101731 TaxID=3032199 RepID=UPI0024A4DE76|nr:helix-turn-helix domain-containing protein [Kineosporia sp. NBRC 101731]GLY28243.1 AraC family transcriptional regulator [Kineosporia sp. NBRC 101731]
MEPRSIDSIEQDSRGIIEPGEFRRRYRLNRYPAGPALEGLISWFWVVSWSLPPGETHTQELLTHPCANLYVSPQEPTTVDDDLGPTVAELEGVVLNRSSRRMAGEGSCVAAMTTPGGLGAFLTGPAGQYNDRTVRLGTAVRSDDDILVRNIGRAQGEPAKVDVLRTALENAVRPERVTAAREVAATARLAETDRTLRKVEHLAQKAGTGVRTLQRMFAEYAGVSPTWVLRRYRLLEAAEAVRHGDRVVWARIAADLGYSDQAHLVRDFSAAIGATPAAYARSLS